LEPTHSIANLQNAPSTVALSLDALDVTALSALTPLQLAALAQRLAALLASISIAQFQHASAQADAKDARDATPTRMIDADEAAAILKRPRRWLFTHSRRMPWIKRLSRKVILIDEAGMHRWIASRH
jgi:hypothetical protein